MTIDELNKKTVTELKEIAEELKLNDISKLKKAELIQKIVESSEKVTEKTNKEETEVAEGILEVLPDGFGFLRSDNYLSGAQDIYVSPTQIRRFNLKTGDKLCGITRAPKEGEKFKALIFVNTVNNDKLEVSINKNSYDIGSNNINVYKKKYDEALGNISVEGLTINIKLEKEVLTKQVIFNFEVLDITKVPKANYLTISNKKDQPYREIKEIEGKAGHICKVSYE